MTTNRARIDSDTKRRKTRGLALLVSAMAPSAFAHDASVGLLTGYRFGGEFEERDSALAVDLDEASSLGVIDTIPQGPGAASMCRLANTGRCTSIFVGFSPPWKAAAVCSVPQVAVLCMLPAGDLSRPISVRA